MGLFKRTNRFFDKLEDSIRAKLSHRPILYALIGGVGITFFWKGVWEVAELEPMLFGLPSVLIGLLLLLPTGLFVSFFVGDSIILSGYKREKKLAEKTESELRAEIIEVKIMAQRIAHIEQALTDLQKSLSKTKSPPQKPEEPPRF